MNSNTVRVPTNNRANTTKSKHTADQERKVVQRAIHHSSHHRSYCYILERWVLDKKGGGGKIFYREGIKVNFRERNYTFLDIYFSI
jgi:hypothetical protein